MRSVIACVTAAQESERESEGDSAKISLRALIAFGNHDDDDDGTAGKTTFRMISL